MPHAGGGGGGGGGGFHSSGSGAHNATPRYDHNGNLHHTYYMRPGFYINRTYIPYERNKRRGTLYLPFIFVALFGIALTLFGFLAYNNHGKFDSERLEEYAIARYYDVYDKHQDCFEENILITIIAYEDNKSYDYFPVVGDLINYQVDNAFGNTKTIFGKEVFENVPHENYYENLYSYLATAVNNVVDAMPSNLLTSNPQTSKIYNVSDYGEIKGQTELIAAELNFFNKTGYRISFYIANENQAYPLDLSGPIIMWSMSLICGAIAIYGLISRTKILNTLNTAFENGEEGQYFEGEDDYETHRRNFPHGL